MFSEEHLYSIALRKCMLIGDINFYKLVAAIGSAKDVWNTPKKELSTILGIGGKTVKDIGNPTHLQFSENELRFCEKNKIKILLRHQNQLPKLLNECEDAPAILYLKGNIDPLLHTVSMVGTRNITPYGKQFISDFLEKAKSSKIISVSGLALGADTEVHEKSIANNIPTIAVLAHGFHTLYPSKNRKLSEKILEENGALLSEFNSSQKPDRENFIQRNRIIAGLSEATLVVETAFGGGSISTATFANGYNREVYALPGKIDEKYSQGCNQLIAQNKARIISTIKDLMEELGLANQKTKIDELFPKTEKTVELPENKKNIYTIIQTKPNSTLDEISEITGIPSFKLLPIMLELELSGFVRALSGKQYRVL